jgi:nucleoid DNA-binding protein
MADAINRTTDTLNLTQEERAKLSGWGFISSYQQFQQQLIELAKGSYRATCILVRPQKPTPIQCYEQYWHILTFAKFYCEDIAKSKLKSPKLYEHGAQLLAKYVLSQDWKIIEKTHCPQKISISRSQRKRKGKLSLHEAQERVREAVEEMNSVLNQLNDTPGLKDERSHGYLTHETMAFLQRTYGIDYEAIPEASIIGRQEITRRIASQAGLSQKKAAEVLEATLDAIRDSLKQGQEVRLSGFGSFKVRRSAARKGVNPRDRKPIQVPAKERVRFFPGKQLEELQLEGGRVPTGGVKREEPQAEGSTSASPEGQELESPEAKLINAWISERTTSPKEPLRVGETYTLNFKVGQPVESSLIAGSDATILLTDIPQGGLDTEWVVNSRTVEFGAASAGVTITSDLLGGSASWTARFYLHVPEQGESPMAQLGITPRVIEDVCLDVLIYARGELYRQFRVELAVVGTQATPQRGDGDVAVVKGETIHAPANQLGLRTLHEWQTPPGKLEIVVFEQGRAFVHGDVVQGNVLVQVGENADWQGDPSTLAGTIKNVSTAAERFRATAESYLNDIEPTDLAHRLENFKPQYGWTQLDDMSDDKHKQAWENVRNSTELRELATYGYDLYELFFPPSSKLRSWLDLLWPGHYLDIKWTDNRGIASVPWGLMYLKDPSLPIDPFGFLGLRFRIQYTSHPVQMTPKQLGSLDETYPTYCLYWGNQAQDDIALEAQWQRTLWTNQTNQVFFPDRLTSPNPKLGLLELLGSPQLRPVSVLYLYCLCSLDKGANLPVLRFAGTNQASDVIKQVELPRGEMLDHPLVFANACTTSAADPYIANELESLFFRRGCRAYLGTETKVPIELASRFAAIFFRFFYRKVDPLPMAAGEAVAQTRLFLWTQYKNIGGLLYTYINKYEVFMANAAEISAMRW